MPLSPLNRLSLVLTLLAFPWVFVTMMEPRSWLAPGLLGIALSLWTAALFGIVKTGASFDERAFHPTRPRGRQRAFTNSSIILLGMISAVSLMAAIRGWHYNLGWQATWAGALIVFSLMFLFTAAVATGFHLCFNEARAKRWVGWIMLALPITLHIVIVETKDRTVWPGAEVFTNWTSALSPAVMTAAALYGVAWWLAGKQKMWWLSLITCGGAGLGLVAVRGVGGREPEMPGPPPRVIEIRRSPLIDKANKESTAGRAPGGLRTFDFIDFLTIDGIANDEILSGIGVLPIPEREESFFRNRFRSQRGFQLLNWRREDRGDPVQKDKTWILASQLPTKPEVEESGSWECGAEMYTEAEEAPTILKQLDERDWEFEGTIYKIVHQGEVPLFEGGSRSMKALGNLKTSPAYSTDHGLIVPYRMVFPVSKFDPNQRFSAPGIQNHALIVNRSGTAAVKSSPWYMGSDDAGVASTWRNSTFHFPLISKWPADELEGATLHIFTNVPVASVKLTLPPPAR